MKFSFKSAGQFAMFCIHKPCPSCYLKEVCINLEDKLFMPGEEKHYLILVKYFRKQKLEKLLSS